MKAVSLVRPIPFRVCIRCTLYLCSFSPRSLPYQAPGITTAQFRNLPAVAPAVECSTLASADISQAVGAPTHITAATVVR